MKYLRAALARIVGFFTGDRANAELREELQAHLEMATAENIRRGMAPDEARRKAMLAAGGLTAAAESVRDQRGLPWLESITADVRYALRSLRRSRVFTARTSQSRRGWASTRITRSSANRAYSSAVYLP